MADLILSGLREHFKQKPRISGHYGPSRIGLTFRHTTKSERKRGSSQRVPGAVRRDEANRRQFIRPPNKALKSHDLRQATGADPAPSLCADACLRQRRERRGVGIDWRKAYTRSNRRAWTLAHAQFRTRRATASRDSTTAQAATGTRSRIAPGSHARVPGATGKHLRAPRFDSWWFMRPGRNLRLCRGRVDLG